MRWILYIVCFLLLGLNTASENTITSCQISCESIGATQIHNYSVISPIQIVSEDLDSESFTPGSAILFSIASAACFAKNHTSTLQFSSDEYSYLLSDWLLDLPPPILV